MYVITRCSFRTCSRTSSNKLEAHCWVLEGTVFTHLTVFALTLQVESAGYITVSINRTIGICINFSLRAYGVGTRGRYKFRLTDGGWLGLKEGVCPGWYSGLINSRGWLGGGLGRRLGGVAV